MMFCKGYSSVYSRGSHHWRTPVALNVMSYYPRCKLQQHNGSNTRLLYILEQLDQRHGVKASRRQKVNGNG